MVATWTLRCLARKAATSSWDMRIRSRCEGTPLPGTERGLGTWGFGRRSLAPGDVEQLGHAGLDSPAEDVDVGHRVVVGGHSEVELAAVGEDHDPNPRVAPDGRVGIAVEQPPAQCVEGLLWAGYVTGQSLNETLRQTRGETSGERQPHRRRKPRHLRQLACSHRLPRLLYP